MGFVDRNPASAGKPLYNAAALSRNLGTEHRVISIDAILQSYLDTLAPAFAGCAEEVTAMNLGSMGATTPVALPVTWCQ
jgi:NH3-dependent NAD+ synthetase